MARSVKSTYRIDIKERVRLAARKQPYWQKLERGLFAGYHRPSGGGAGAWWARVLVAVGSKHVYREKALATAYDYVGANGETVLNWSQAQAAARAWATASTRARSSRASRTTCGSPATRPGRARE